MKQSIFFALFFLLIQNTGSIAQRIMWYEIDTSQNLVISPNGLKIRNKPGQEGDVLATVPFGKQVKVLSQKDYGKDTVGVHLFYNNYAGTEDIPYEQYVTGHWVRVSWQGKTGYMFNGYLGGINYLYKSDDEPAEINQDYYLLYPRTDCNATLHDLTGFNTYGIYLKQGVYVRYKVKISYFTEASENFFRSLNISTNDNKDLLFIVCTRKTLKEGILSDQQISIMSREDFGGTAVERAALMEKKMSKCQLQAKLYNDSPFLEIWYKNDKGQRQNLVSPFVFQFDWTPYFLIWCGDLDDDGKKDFILFFGEKNAVSILFLSSEAAEGQLLNAVAASRSGYCC